EVQALHPHVLVLEAERRRRDADRVGAAGDLHRRIERVDHAAVARPGEVPQVQAVVADVPPETLGDLIADLQVVLAHETETVLVVGAPAGRPDRRPPGQRGPPRRRRLRRAGDAGVLQDRADAKLDAAVDEERAALGIDVDAGLTADEFVADTDAVVSRDA